MCEATAKTTVVKFRTKRERRTNKEKKEQRRKENKTEDISIEMK